MTTRNRRRRSAGVGAGAASRKEVGTGAEHDATLSPVGTLGERPAPLPRPAPILFLHPADDIYGSGRVLLSTVEAALEEGREVTVVLPDDTPPGWLSGQLQQRGVAVRKVPLAVARRQYLNARQLPGYVRQFFRARSTIKGQIRELRPGIVQVNTSVIPVMATIGRQQETRVIWHVHELVVSPRPVAWILRHLPMLTGDDVVAISDAVASNLRRARFSRSRVHRVYNGIPARERPDEQHREKARCVFVGRLSWFKGYDVFVEAAAVVANTCPEARFTIAGGPKPGEEWRLPLLRKRLQELGIADRTDVLGVCDDVVSLFDRSAVVVVPSRWPEPFGRVTVEAMRSSCAVVGSAIGATPEILTHEESGLLVPPGDAAALAAAVVRLLQDGALRQRLGDAAHERVMTLFPEEKFRSSIQAVWRRSDP